MTKGFFLSPECEASKIISNGINGRAGVFYYLEDIFPLLDKIGKFSPCVVEIEVPSESVKQMPDNSKKFYFCGSIAKVKRVRKLEDVLFRFKLESV